MNEKGIEQARNVKIVKIVNCKNCNFLSIDGQNSKPCKNEQVK